jgi:hypothetical protein
MRAIQERQDDAAFGGGGEDRQGGRGKGVVVSA